MPRRGFLRGVRARASLGAGLVVAIAFIIGALGLAWALADSLRGAAEQRAEDRAEELVTALERGDPDTLAGAESGASNGDDEDDPDDLAWQVSAEDGGVVASAGTGGADLPTDASDGTIELDGERYLLAHERLAAEDSDDGERYDIVVAVSLEDRDETLAALWPLLLIAVPVAVLLVVGTTWIVAGRALRPVERIRSEVATIGSGALDRRVPVPESGDEIARLAVTMNEMLVRLQNAATRQQQFVSDTSHELRSPLASLRQTAEVARSHPDAIPVEEVTEAVLEETARMQHLVEQMLVLTRTSEAGNRPRSEVDLDDLLLSEASRLRRTRVDLRVDLASTTAARTLGDAPALARVVRNLVDNAARHARATIRLSSGPATTASGFVSVVVEDDGEGVAAEDAERVFERFVRLDEARARDGGGSGLGLAIVREVVRAHGGDAFVAPSDLGGARFVVQLPGS